MYLLGQARLLYQHAATLINADAAQSRRFGHLLGARSDGAVTEDTLAYFRDTHEFRNGTLAELHASDGEARHQMAQTVSRLFLRQTPRNPAADDNS